MDFKDKILEIIEKKLDAVNKDALKKDFDDRADKDIDNDGEVDDQDEYLHNRRKAITKAMKKEEADVNEVLDTPEKMDRYRNKAKYSKERAAKSAVATILRSKDSEFRAHPAKDLKTIAKRTAGEKMADRNAARKFRKSMNKEEVELIESHFEVGDKVKCIASGMEGKVAKVDPKEKGKYYTVKRDDGKMMKYAPDELEALNESVIAERRYGRKNMPRDPLFIKAKYDTVCPETGKKIKKGDECAYYPNSKKAYHKSSKAADDVRGLNFSKMMGMDEDYQLDEADGWIAMYNGKKLEITKSDAKDLYGAKIHAARELKVPKSKMGLLAIKPAYNESKGKIDYENLKQQALKAAYPFGGNAMPFQMDVIKMLVKDGLVEILSKEPLDGSINYGLTAKGKALVKK